MNQPLRAVRWLLLAAGFALVWAVGFGCGLLVQSLGWWVGGGAWERELLIGVHRTVSPALDLVFLTLPYVGTNYTLVPVVAIVCAILYRKGYRAAAAHLAIIQAGSAILNPVLKAVFERPRPDLFEMRGQFGMSAFPSGHSIAAASVVFTAAYLLFRYRGIRWPLWVAGVFFLLNSYSRVYLAVHWPTDVIAGSLIGFVWLWVGLAAFRPAHDLALARSTGV